LIMHSISSGDKVQNLYIPFSLGYNFDYTQFENPELESKAKNAVGNFLGFVRQTFDGLLEQGRRLQEIYLDCVAKCHNGKKIFHAWLASEDFGASSFVARSAMEIFAWFQKLQPRVQRLVKQNVQTWSVSALRQLTKVSTNLVKELVTTGRKTAAQIKTVCQKKKNGKKTPHLSDNSSNVQPISSAIPELAPGVRVVVTDDKRGCPGYSGVIVSQWSENGADSWWVLLDYVQAQGGDTKHLYKSNQIQPEAVVSNVQTSSTQMFTLAQVEEKIAEAIAQYEKEKAESELGRFIEIRDAALLAAKEELLAAQQQAKQELAQQLIAKERELDQLRSLRMRNQQLEQRVELLEQALCCERSKNAGNTFNEQVAKVVNSELESTVAPLMSEVERLNDLLEARSSEIAQLQAINTKLHLELRVLQQQSAPKSLEILTQFDQIEETLSVTSSLSNKLFYFVENITSLTAKEVKQAEQLVQEIADFCNSLPLDQQWLTLAEITKRNSRALIVVIGYTGPETKEWFFNLPKILAEAAVQHPEELLWVNGVLRSQAESLLTVLAN
ncbi:MAG: hypothetical protein HC908_17480, partial [Calothrix sp. SM1_7_51]|nr:hypothetical protein [Calothrix sp. SM1_7_51]